jgi:PhnB protein
MTTWIPAGWHSITPRLVVAHPARLVQFLRTAFGAKGELRDGAPAVMTIGDSLVMVSGIEPRPPMPAFIYISLEDSHETNERALDAGARSVEGPTDTPYGDRRAIVEDPCGNLWQIATHQTAMS